MLELRRNRPAYVPESRIPQGFVLAPEFQTGIGGIAARKNEWRCQTGCGPSLRAATDQEVAIMEVNLKYQNRDLSDPQTGFAYDMDMALATDDKFTLIALGYEAGLFDPVNIFVGAKCRVGLARPGIRARIFPMGRYGKLRCRLRYNEVPDKVSGSCPPSRNVILSLADLFQREPRVSRPSVVASLKAKIRTFSGRSGHGGGLHSIVEMIQRHFSGEHYGGCAEADAISKALFYYERSTGRKVTTIEQARQILEGSRIQTSNVRGPNSTGGRHGAPQAPCSSCQPLLNILGIRYE